MRRAPGGAGFRGRGPGFQVEVTHASGASAGPGGGPGAAAGSSRAPTALGPVGRWRRFPGSAPGRRGRCVPALPSSLCPAVAGAGEAGRAGAGEERREGGGCVVRAAGGGPAGEEAEAGAVSHAAPGGAAPAADGRSQTLAGRGLPGPGPSDRAETSPEPFRPQGNAGECRGAGAEGRRRRPGPEPRCRSGWRRCGRAQAPGEA